MSLGRIEELLDRRQNDLLSHCDYALSIEWFGLSIEGLLLVFRLWKDCLQLGEVRRHMDCLE